MSIVGSGYRELESGVERHKSDVMGNDPRFNMNAEQEEVMSRCFFCNILHLTDNS